MAGRKRKNDGDLDDVIASLDAREARNARAMEMQQSSKSVGKEQIGSVEGFFDKISVVAIKLNRTLKVGDVIEIGTEYDAIRQRVSSMQINRVNVEEVHDGDSVGIKLKHRVTEGESVYKIG